MRWATWHVGSADQAPHSSALAPCLRSVARSIPDEDAGTEGAIFVFRRLVEEEEEVVEEEVRTRGRFGL